MSLMRTLLVLPKGIKSVSWDTIPLVPSELSDDELPWATVMYPVTIGGGTGNFSQTANLRQGMFVFGFFMDGEDGQQPVIMGVVGTNSHRL